MNPQFNPLEAHKLKLREHAAKVHAHIDNPAVKYGPDHWKDSGGGWLVYLDDRNQPYAVGSPTDEFFRLQAIKDVYPLDAVHVIMDEQTKARYIVRKPHS